MGSVALPPSHAARSPPRPRLTRTTTNCHLIPPLRPADFIQLAGELLGDAESIIASHLHEIEAAEQAGQAAPPYQAQYGLGAGVAPAPPAQHDIFAAFQQAPGQGQAPGGYQPPPY